MLNLIELEALVAAAMESAKVPGVALAIVHERQLIYARGFGVTSIEEGGIPVTPGTIFRIGSTTKPLTSTAIMSMVAAGQLELDTPIDEVLPDLQLSVPGAISQVTLRKLLTHTAALPTAAEHYGSREAAGLRESVYKDIATYPLIAPVGKMWSYSNPGINLAGYIAELVSGKTYTQLMQELVFDPLEMKRTTFDPTIAMTYPLAQSHNMDAQGNLSVDHHYADNTMHYPSGFAMSTVLDLANFAIMHLSGGKFGDRQVLAPERVAEMHAPHAKFPSLTDDGYGLTLSSHNYRGVRVVGHGGRISSFASGFDFVPETGTAVIMLANNAALWGKQEEKILYYILDALLDLPEPEPVPVIEPDRTRWDHYVGTYVGANSGAADITRDGDTLSLVWQGQPLPLHAARPDLYLAQVPDGTHMAVSFTQSGDAPAEAVSVVVVPGHSVTLDRLPIDPTFQPDPTQWTDFVGTYDSPLTKLIIRMEGDQMLVSSPLFGGVEMPARPVDANRFVFPVGLLTFTPGAVSIGVAVRFTKVTS
ncbi:MAG: beta-lactamase family protein [Chloroflexi bacterium]|uniref:serine hydrolase domain-containing protein n=1 Tax=Candidatus Flexifilum breve TaxID=3140694 RepID=UPI00313703F8|nr:beta-lactamase family protein [Chloroflexota bacterium]